MTPFAENFNRAVAAAKDAAAMARPYVEEMVKLAETFTLAEEVELQPLQYAVRIVGSSPLRVVGSGCSHTDTHALARLRQRYIGHLAVAATPP